MKRLFITLLILLIPVMAFSADTEVQDLTDITTAVVGDDLYVVDSPDVTPASKKISIGALLDVMTGEVTSATGVTTIADTVTVTGWTMGTSAGTSPAADDDDTSLATTAYVQTEINALGGTDLTCAAGSCNVDSPVTSASAVTNATLTTALTVDTGTVTLTGNVANTSVLTIGAGAVGVSGSNTGDNTVATTGDAAVDFFGAGVDAVTDATEVTDVEGTNLTIGAGTLNVDNPLVSAVTGAASGNLLNSESDVLIGTLTADGLTLGQDENITLGAQTLDHDGTDFVFNDTISATNVSGTNTGDQTIPVRHSIALIDPVATDDFFFGEVAVASTWTSIYCKTLVGTVDLDVSIGGVDINNTDITCNTTGVLDEALGGDTAGAVGEEVALVVTSVATSPTYLMVILNGELQ